MEQLFIAFDIVYTLLAAGALAMIAFAHREMRAARIMVGLAAALIAARWTMWAFATEQPWWVRAIVGGLFGGLLLAALPALYSWAQERGAPHSSSETSAAQTELQSRSSSSSCYRVDNAERVVVEGNSATNCGGDHYSFKNDKDVKIKNNDAK
jgi:hypothetical protein